MPRAVAFFAGLGSGYVNQKEREAERERQARIDQMAQETHDAQMAEVRKKQAGDAAVAQAYAPAVAGANDASLPAYADARDIGTDPTATPIPTATANDPNTQRGRAIAALRGLGDIDRADALDARGRAGEAANMQLQQGKDALARDTAFRSVVTRFMKGGWQSLPEIYKDYNDGNTATVHPDGNGGALVTKIGADGKVLGQRNYASPLEFVTETIAQLDPRLYLQHAEAQAKEAREARTAGAQVRKDEAQARLADAQAAVADQGGKAPVGYRFKGDGTMEAIPGGPADMKIQGQFNQDTASLTSSMSGFDRLATAANELLNHPGIGGITGLRGKLPNMPGSDASNAEALLNTLKSQVAFGVLQDMRNNSKTGGALGNVSDAEGRRLESNLAALEKSQSLDQFKTNLQKIVSYTEKAKDRLRAAYNLKYDAANRSTSTVAPNAATDPATKVDPQAQKQRDADAALVLQQELRAAQERLAKLPQDAAPDLRRRAQADVDGVSKEMKRRGVQPASATTAPAAPQVGAVDSGFRFKGGDPADPANWERLQ